MPTIDPASRPSGPDVSFVLSVSDVPWSKPSPLTYIALKGGRRYGYADDRPGQ
jgi:hypothetical protein